MTIIRFWILSFAAGKYRHRQISSQTNIIFILLLVLLLPSGLKAQSNNQMSMFKMMHLFDWIGNYYVDTLNMDKLGDKIIRQTLRELDPHSVYITKDEVRAMNEPLEGSFDGIGVSFNILNDTILIISAIQGGPSEKVGIMDGDKIITINGVNVAGIGINDNGVRSRLRGPKGTEVSVGIRRRGYPELLQFRIVRDKIPLYSIDAAYKVTDGIGYIKLSRFAASSKREFDSTMLKLQKEGVFHLILDLTGNGGGYLETAAELATNFLERGRLIVYTKGEHTPRRDYSVRSNGKFMISRLVLMIDERSASASEILAGAIQDWDRGTIVGRRSFGKGLVQRQLVFPDSSMMRLTVARYYTPTGRAIQKPYNTKNDEYATGIIGNRLRTGELTGETSATGADSLKYLTLNRRRTVYGGGGITPDIFVALDTSYYTPYYRKLFGLGIFNRFVLNYVDQNRQQLKRQYPTFEQFDQRFVVTEAMMNELQNFAEKEGLIRNPEMFAKSESNLRLWLKGNIARDLWDTSEMYQVVNWGDPIFLKALEEIQK